MLIKFLKDYGEVKEGDIRDTKTDADAQTLIDEGVAVKYIETVSPEPTPKELDIEEMTKAVEEKVRAELKADIKVPAQAKEEKSPWNGFGDFAQAVIAGRANEKLMNYCKSSGMNEAVNADGGFLIPSEFSTVLLTAMNAKGVIAPKCRDFPVNNNLSLPFVNNTTQATSWTGGITIYKPAEGVAKTTSLPQLATCELNLHKMTGVVYSTDELLNDSPLALETFLSTMVSTEFALTKDEDIVNGSGAGEALGLINSPCLISVSIETDQDADTIVTQNVLKMWSRMYSPSRNSAIWLIAPDAMPQIAALTLDVGTGGAPVFIADLKNPLGSTLLGSPIEWSPHCQTVGDKGDIILADFSQYVTLSKAGMGMETATSIHLKFLEDETAFRFVVRFDGQPWWASDITPKHGDTTVSPFITLNERA